MKKSWEHGWIWQERSYSLKWESNCTILCYAKRDNLKNLFCTINRSWSKNFRLGNMIWKLKIIAKLSAYFTLCMFQVIFKNEEQLLHAFIFDFCSLITNWKNIWKKIKNLTSKNLLKITFLKKIKNLTSMHGSMGILLLIF